jgi:hypothetical protein
MKRNSWFYLSVALNIALASALLWRRSVNQVVPPSVDGRAAAVTAVSAPIVSERIAVSQKPKSWVEMLRAAEVSEKVIARVAAADFEANWTERRDALQRQFEHGDLDGDAMKLFHLQHDAEEEKALRTALGDEGFRRWDQEKLLRDYNIRGVNLSARETEDLYALRKGMEQKRHDLALAALKGDIDETTFDRQTEEAQQKLEQDSKNVLGDDRYAMVSKTDSSQGDLKRVLAAVDSDPSQAAAVLQAEQQWTEQQAALEKQLHDGQITSSTYQQQMNALNTARDNEYQRQLGTNGFAALQKAQDNRYRLMQHFASAWKLDAREIDTLYAGIQGYESGSQNYLEQAHALQDSGQAVDWTSVQAALQQYSKSTEDYFRKMLGDERFKQLERNHVLTFSE